MGLLEALEGDRTLLMSCLIIRARRLSRTGTAAIISSSRMIPDGRS